MDGLIEHEVCGNCKKEIPQHNYVMHSAHCARNITLCQVCKEPVPKSQFEEHKKGCVAVKPKAKKPPPPAIPLEENQYYQERRQVEEKKAAARRERQLQKYDKLVDTGYSLKNSSTQPVTNGKPEEKKKEKMMACKYCELELPKAELEEHENYCGTRTDRCLECGELVMFKYKQIHMDSNHGFLKLKDEPGPRASWDSSSQRRSNDTPSSPLRPRPSLRPFSGLDTTSYNFPSTYSTPAMPKEKGESYKEISRRLDCKTEYIRNLLHDSACITVPLRHSGAVPRNHFNHNKGPAPQPPLRRRNPPTELTIPCEFCSVPIPHEDLIQHETGCRPDLARRRRASPELDDYFIPPQPSSPEVELPWPEARQSCREENDSSEVKIPCEFCSQLLLLEDLVLHETGCRPDLARFDPKISAKLEE